MKNNIKLKEELLNAVSTTIDSVLKELSIIDNEISKKKEELIKISSEYSNVFTETEKAKEEIVSREIKLNSDIVRFEDMERNLNQKIDSFEKHLNEVELELKEKVKSRDSIVLETKQLQDKLDKMSALSITKSTIIKEIDEQKNQLSSLQKEIEDTKNEQDSLIKDLESKKALLVKELSSIEKDIKQKQDVIFPQLNALTERESTLNKKEADLKIVEERYRRLYADAGASFKL